MTGEVTNRARPAPPAGLWVILGHVLNQPHDVANGAFVGEDQAGAIQAAGRRLLQVHLPDASRTAWDHAPIGRSTIDFGAISRALQAAEFGGTSIVELISDDVDADMADAHKRLVSLGWR